MSSILQQVSLSGYSTMRLGGSAAYLTHVHDRYELLDALDWAEKRSLPVLMIGSGSNIVWRDEGLSGLVLVNRIEGFACKVDGDDLYLTIGGGENWDRVWSGRRSPAPAVSNASVSSPAPRVPHPCRTLALTVRRLHRRSCLSRLTTVLAEVKGERSLYLTYLGLIDHHDCDPNVRDTSALSPAVQTLSVPCLETIR